MEGVYRRRGPLELSLFGADWIPGSMVLNLKGKKLVHRLERLGIMRHDSDHPSSRGRRVGVSNLAMLLLHHWYAGRDPIVNEHRNFKIVCAEHRGNMLQMFSDLVPGGHVILIPSVDLDDSPVGQLLEVMLRILVREPHGVIPTHVHTCRVLVRRFLAWRALGSG